MEVKKVGQKNVENKEHTTKRKKKDEINQI